MRPSANFTLHAILAACLAALAASGAAAKLAGDGTTEQFFTIELQDGRSTDGKGQHLEVQSYHWGTATSAVHLERNYVKSWSTSGDATGSPSKHGEWIADVERPQSRGAGRNELGMDDTAGKEKMQPGGGAASGGVTAIATDPSEPAANRRASGHSMLGASDRVTVGGAHSPSGQATGTRFKPLLTPGYFDAATPPARGSLTVLASAGACRVGARYPSLALNGGGRSYVLQDVRVAGCGDPAAAGPTEEITFVYGKVRVRGWDPAKKEN